MTDQAGIKVNVPEGFKEPVPFNTYRIKLDEGKIAVDFGQRGEDTIDVVASVEFSPSLLERFLPHIIAAMKDYEKTYDHRFEVFRSKKDASPSANRREGEA